MDINRKSNLTCFTNLDLKRVQCVSRIWTSFSWLHLLMVVRFQAQADFHYYPSCITIDAHFKSGQKQPKNNNLAYYSKSVIHSVCKKLDLAFSTVSPFLFRHLVGFYFLLSFFCVSVSYYLLILFLPTYFVLFFPFSAPQGGTQSH